MRILGIDPGTTAMGCAILEVEEGREPQVLHAGIATVISTSTSERLRELHEHLRQLITVWEPDVLAVEKLFFAKNVKTALDVSQGRGVILLTGALAGLTVYEYTPLEVKKIVTGDGTADKAQVQKMLKLTIPAISELRARDDVFDAIAIALTCFFCERAAMRARPRKS
ncbi:MAG: crossover junction endodeoxyribonuclease RuvC [bacterium]|nr:crossover junction endodeoxyribonuclease RuvC [bacterium]